MVEIAFNEYEIELVRFFAQRSTGGEEIVNMKEVPRYDEVGKEKVYHIRKRFTDYGLLKGYSSEDVEVLPTVLELVQQWDNPPLPDYRDKMTKWFWSKRWSMVVYVLVVGLPALLGWVVMLKTILEWLGVRK